MPYDEPKLLALFKEVAQKGPRAGIGYLKRHTRELICVYGTEFLSALMECLITRGPYWQQELHRAGQQRKGVFRELAGRVLRRHALAGKSRALSESPIPFDVIKAHRHPYTDELRILEFSQEDLSIFELHKTIEKLDRLGPGPHCIQLDFHGETLYTEGLCIIAAWCERHGANFVCRTDHNRAHTYLDRIGFVRFVIQGDSTESVQFDRENFVALTRILRKEKSDANTLAGRVVDLFSRHIKELGVDNARALKTTIAELVENLYIHSETDFPGYVIAQAHPTTRMISLGIADTGIGIYDSFRRSDNDIARAAASTPKDALEAAIRPLVTSKSSGHSGYGLYVVHKLAELNGGTFRLTSGRYTHLLRPKTRKRQGWPRPIVEHAPWQGTFIGVLLNMDKPMNLAKVYETLPIPEGYEREDFFS